MTTKHHGIDHKDVQPELSHTPGHMPEEFWVYIDGSPEVPTQPAETLNMLGGIAIRQRELYLQELRRRRAVWENARNSLLNRQTE